MKPDVLRAHINLMRARNLGWGVIGLPAMAAALSSFWDAADYLALFSLPCGILALGFSAIAGNHLGRFGLKYPVAAVIGGAVLSRLVMPPAALLAFVAAFFWLKHDIGEAYRATQQPEDAGA